MSLNNEYNEELLELYKSSLSLSETIDELRDTIDELKNKLDNTIDVENLVYRMIIDGVYTKEFKEWFENYLAFYTQYDK